MALPPRNDLGETGIPDWDSSLSRPTTTPSPVPFPFNVTACCIVIAVVLRPSRPRKRLLPLFPLALLGTTVVDELIDTEESLDVILECILPFMIPLL